MTRAFAFFLAARITLLAWGNGSVDFLPGRDMVAKVPTGCNVTSSSERKRMPRVKIKLRLDTDGRGKI